MAASSPKRKPISLDQHRTQGQFSFAYIKSQNFVENSSCLFFLLLIQQVFSFIHFFFFIPCSNEVRSQARCISSRYFLRHPYFSVFKKWEIEYKGNVNCRLRIICSNISVANIFTDARALKLLAKLLLPYILYLSQPRVNARLRKPQTSKLSYLIDFSLHVNFRNWN